MALLLDGSDASIARAAAQLARGGLLGLPTETVYGLAADANNAAAVASIFSAKGRPSDHPLIAHIAAPAQRSVDAWREALAPFVQDVPPFALTLAQAFWPGPLTLVFRRRPDMCEATAGGLTTLAVRCPAHPLAQRVLQTAQALGVVGVAAPSANRFGKVSPTTAAHVMDEFANQLSDEALCVLDGGACQVGIESTIVDCSRASPVLLRPGMLSVSALSEVLGQAIGGPDAHAPKVSGSLESHYAPDARVQLWPAATLRSAWGALSAAQRAVTAIYAPQSQAFHGAVCAHDMPVDAQACAHELFAVLRALDQPDVRHIWVQQPPHTADWAGVNDRLQRAAA